MKTDDRFFIYFRHGRRSIKLIPSHDLTRMGESKKLITVRDASCDAADLVHNGKTWWNGVMTRITQWLGLADYTIGDAIEDGSAIVALSLFTACVFAWAAILY